MPEADVIIAWNHGPVPAVAKDSFQRPTKFIALPNPDKWSEAAAKYGQCPVRGVLTEYAPGTTPLRVAVLGFSASCQGVAQVLGSGDGGRIDSAVAIDGLHVGYANGKVNPASMKPWFEFAKQAIVNSRLFIDTHSSIVPPGYASTTETADWLWDTLTDKRAAFTEPPLPDLSAPPTTIHVSGGPATGTTRDVYYPEPAWQPFKRAGGLVILGCDNRDGPGTADHIYQAKVVLPLVLTKILAERWNNMDPHAPGQSCYTG